MHQQSIKEQAYKLIDELPADATWRDVEYLAAVRAGAENGLDGGGRATPVKDILKDLCLADVCEAR
jgi:hypothetical protein